MPLTDADKSFIRKEYERVLSKKLSTKSGCKDCWRDAIIEILSALKGKKKYTMHGGVIIRYNNVVYGRHNITDEIVEKYLLTNPNDKNKFIQ